MGDSPREALKRDLRACLSAALRAVEPERLVTDFLGGEAAAVQAAERIWIAGFGKAAAAMARGAARAIGERVAGGALVVPAGPDGGAPDGIDVFEGGHPIPNRRGVVGAETIRLLARDAGADDLVLVLISGGGSALMTLPAGDVSLEDIQTTTGALLRAGADIGELNTVRKHLDSLKGGQLARVAAPARVLALVLSDVVGDPLDVIASGPVSPDPSSFAMAIAVLEQFGLWAAAPAAVRDHLERGATGSIEETPKPGDDCFGECRVHIVGNNRMAAEAACAEAERLGYSVELSSTAVTGEAREVGAELARIATAIATGARAPAPPACVVSAGETTVTVTGKGKGGRNQEVALAAALHLDGVAGAGRPLLVASVGTDGVDGPTDAAGAVATADSVARGRALGLEAASALADNDSYPFFRALGDLIVTGPTGTNVMDLHFVMSR